MPFSPTNIIINYLIRYLFNCVCVSGSSEIMEQDLRKALKDLLKNDKDLLKSLRDHHSDTENSPKKRKASELAHSPLRLKKVKLSSNSLQPTCSKNLPAVGDEESGTRSPDEIGSLPESNDGARISSSPQPDGELNDLGILEQLLADNEEQFNDDSEKDESDSETSDFEVIGGPTQASWKVKDKVLKWFQSVADIELKQEDLKALKDKYKVGDSLQKDFEPPKLPNSIWNSMTSNSKADTFRLRSLFRSQESLYLSLVPLLSALDSAPKELREHLTSAIQLICHSNLSLNRYRRSTVIPYIKKDIRKQMLNLPVSHSALFGEDFEKSTDSVLKEHSALSKVFIQKRPIQQRLGKQPLNQSGGLEAPFQKKFRGKPRGGKGGYKNTGGGAARGGQGFSKTPERGGNTGSSYNSSA